MLKGLPGVGIGFGHDERKLVVHTDNNGLSRGLILDPKPPSAKLAGLPLKYSVVPEALPTPPPANCPQSVTSYAPFSRSQAYASNGHNGIRSFTSSGERINPDEIKPLLPQVKHVTKFCEIYHNASHIHSPLDIGLPLVQELSLNYIHGAMGELLFRHLEIGAMDHFKTELLNVALLCATIAAGVQISDIDEASRRGLLRQYVTQTMQLLRIADVLAFPQIAAYPVLLVVSKVIQDELEPILSWSLLGSVRRLAQTYAIVCSWPDPYDEATRHLRDVENLRNLRQRQEAFLAIIMGQTHNLDRGVFPNTHLPAWANATQVMCMDGLAAIASLCASEHIDRDDQLLQLAEVLRSIQPIEKYALPHLADRAKCRSLQEVTEHSSLRIHERLVNLHYCQVIMAACRRLPGHEEEYFRTGETCQLTARECIDTYLSMLTVNHLLLRSWILTVAALRSALVLGVMLAEANVSPAVAEPDRDQLQKLLEAFNPAGHEEGREDRTKWIRRYPEAFRRLQEMCDALGKHPDGRSATAGTNGVSASIPSPVQEAGTALKWMSREAKDDVMMPSRMFKTYFASPVADEAAGLGGVVSQQLVFGI